MEKATDLRGIHQQFSPKPIPVEELDKYYVVANEGRGENATKGIELVLLDNTNVNTHFTFAGYKGCGKSTELNLLQKRIQDKFLVINFSVAEELDPVHLNYIELFILTMEKLFDFAVEKDIDIDDDYMKSIREWLETTEIQEIKDKYIGGEIEAASESSFGIPYLQKFFLKLRTSAKISRSMKEILTRNVEPKLSQLVQHCNDLIGEVKRNLPKIGKEDMLIIIEDLDKIPLNRSHDLFYNYSGQLTQLQTNCIFTFPISLVYHPDYNTISSHFQPFTLPMIKVNNKDGSPFELGREIMRTIVRKRMDDTLFEDENMLEDMIENCGGCLRDLFRLIKSAALDALIYEKEKITKDDYRHAYNRLKRDYSNGIADKIAGDQTVLAKDYYDTLIALVNSKTKQPDNTIAALDLRQNLSILGYNDDGWCDVHPLVRQVLKDKGLIK